jgi:hypothetical protein
VHPAAERISGNSAGGDDQAGEDGVLDGREAGLFADGAQ